MSQDVKERLRSASEDERLRLLALILREARDPDVRLFVRPEEVAGSWPRLEVRLGRRRPFRVFLLEAWRRQGLLTESS